MSGIPGRIARLEVSDDAGVTWKNVGGIVESTLNINVDELEVTTYDSAGHREYIPNHDDATLDLTCRWLEEDPGQSIILGKMFDKSTYQVRFRLQSVAGRRLFTATAFATKGSPKAPLDDASGFDVSLRMSGLGVSTQTTAMIP